MDMERAKLLAAVKQEEWFYEFRLPDGDTTRSYLPQEVRPVHHTRERALIGYLESRDEPFRTAVDVACHEGYFSVLLARYCETVVGIDRNAESLRKARRMLEVLGQAQIRLETCSVEEWSTSGVADLVLCYGLLYHAENPIEILRRLVQATRRSLIVETQVLPFETTGRVEDGSYQWQRELQGTFGLCVDYSDRPEGGLTNLALVPSRGALSFLLTTLGCQSVRFYQPRDDDYEQFRRGQRVIVFAEKAH